MYSRLQNHLGAAASFTRMFPMSYRVFIDHGIRRAVLHTDTCRSYRERPAFVGRDCSWSDHAFASEDDARRSTSEYLRDGNGPYDISAHSCVGSGE
jgi:hypothetical protein